ncbi:MAG TPA: hypothetical protein VFS05_04550 [Gemmatimonadaceae bacterium]|nr:hypothetical protein [Gemmatimonadaceae bacterium]
MRHLALLALLALAPALAAQDARLAARLDARTRAAVAAVVDSARAAGLPAEPLVDKALEGASKRAPGARIVAAVRALAGELATARAALGAGASDAELVAAAGALHAGTTAGALSRLRAVRPREPLTVPLGVVTDLAARGVPADSAAAVVLTVARTGGRDDDFLALRRDVEQAIGSGVPPAAAAARARGLPFDRTRTTELRAGSGDAKPANRP